jgi:hypothetical protein
VPLRPIPRYVLGEERLHLRQVEHVAGKLGMRFDDLAHQVPAATANIEHR